MRKYLIFYHNKQYIIRASTMTATPSKLGGFDLDFMSDGKAVAAFCGALGYKVCPDEE